MNEEAKQDLYEFEISRFQELMAEDRSYAFQRYGLTMFYSLPTEQTFRLMTEFGWKGKDPLDYYNQGTLECEEGKFKEAMKNFEKAESMNCTQPELFFNMAVIFEDQGDAAKANAYYQKYIDSCEQWDDLPKKLQQELDEVREHLKTN